MRKILIILFLVSIVILNADVQDKLVQFGADNGKLYLKPLVTAFGTTMNSGLYHTARVLKPFTFGVSINTMVAFVPSEEKLFLPTRPDLYISHPVSGETIYLYEVPTEESATFFGEDGTIIAHNPDLDYFLPGADSLDIKMPNGANLPAIPFLMPQFTLGLPLGNELLIRGFPTTEIRKDVGDLGFWGVGLKHSLDQYIPLFPIDVSVQATYQTLYLGDYLEFNNINANLEVSKKLLMWTFYSGLGYDKTNVSADYTYKYDAVIDNGLGGVTIESKEENISFNIDGENEMRATGGVRFSFLLLKMYADYTVSKYPVLNLGMAISF